MRKPLFVRQEKKQIPTIAKCGACGLYKRCKSPKMPISGKGEKGILIVGEAPGEMEDKANRPFVGPTGQMLESTLRRLGIEMRRDCWLTNSLICRPASNLIEKEVLIDYCRANVFNAISQLLPSSILLLGNRAVRSVIGQIWEKDPKGIGRWAGWKIPSIELNAWVCPTYHPAYLLHKEDQKEVATLLFERHLEEALKLTTKPYDKIPDYLSQVEIILSPEKVARIIRDMISKGGTIAFDYETQGLKPEGNLDIVSCSVCWQGLRTIAYPFVGEAIKATKELLLSPLKKIASNVKFEHRWSLHHLGVEVKNWAWDTMVTAHLLDNRKDISGLKFQSFVRLGFGVYDSKIKPYLEADHASAKNNINQCDLNELLRYNGLDSLLEYLVAHNQAKELGVSI